MNVFLLALLGSIIFVLLIAVPYVLWYGRVRGVAEEQGRRSDVLLAVAWITAVGVALYERFAVGWLPFGGWLLALGMSAMVAGISIRLLCRRTLGRYYLPQLKIQPGHRLITSGPYRYLRHPMYAGSLLAYIGLTVALGSVLGTLLMCTVVAGILIYRIHVEEELLAAHFGEEWQEYTRRMKYRIIPYIF